MRFLQPTLLALAAVVFLAKPATATSISDNFDTENGGVYALNYYGFANFTVTSGSVDLIGAGSPYDAYPGNGLYIDMAGSTGQYGALTTNQIFSAGAYNVTLQVGGPIYAGISDGLEVMCNCTVATHSTGDVAGLSVQTFSFNVILLANGTFSIADLGDSGNPNIGATLLSVDITPVPEPATIALIGVGLLGAGALGRRRKKLAGTALNK